MSYNSDTVWFTMSSIWLLRHFPKFHITSPFPLPPPLQGGLIISVRWEDFLFRKWRGYIQRGLRLTHVNQYFFSPGMIWGSAELCFSSTCVNRSCTSATSDFRDLTLPSTPTHSALRFMAGTLSGVKKVKLISWSITVLQTPCSQKWTLSLKNQLKTSYFLRI